MNEISDSISEIALKRRQMRLNATTDTNYSWMTADIAKKRRSSLIETNITKKEPKGFIAELKSLSTSKPSSSSSKKIKMTATNCSLPVISCYCNGKETTALLNTSLSLSTMTEDFARKLRIQDDVKVQLIIGSVKHAQQIRLIPKPDEESQDLCLGIDFLSSTRGIVNFKDKCLTLGQVNIPFV